MKIVLFDIDGTLIKAGGSGVRALNRAVREMTGCREACKAHELQGSTDKSNFELAFKAGKGRKPTKKETDELVRRYLSLLPEEVKASLKAKKYEKVKGVEKFLEKLAKTPGVMIGLGTGNLKDGAFIKLGPSGFMKYFAFGGYGCDSHHRAEVLEKAVGRAAKIAKGKITPSEVYVIGDTHRDVEAAKECGYRPAAVLDGFGDAHLILRSNPELMEKDFSGMKPWLLWLGLKKDPRGVSRGTYICPDSPIEHAHYGRTGMDLRDIETGIKKLREARRKVIGGGK
ncbi:MAG: putative phosphatase [Elusimicrobia bacterium]|nr:MAG: putative phosphatase [Elusimicrobiota bacterium]KAF0158127.1 MAG: putative phosphatase [Elusimicrobiota bacterium]